MKTIPSNTIAKWYKRLGFAGAARWRLLYWVYKLWPGLHIRDAEWEWVLNYLPPIMTGQAVFVLDVGATSSLFIYELKRRGYKVSALDIRPYQEDIQKHGIIFYEHDICEKGGFFNYAAQWQYSFIVCISVLEHIKYRPEALLNMIALLGPNGRLLLTIPTTEYAQGHPWSGFTWDMVRSMLPPKSKIIEYTERKGQMCLAITKWI